MGKKKESKPGDPRDSATIRPDAIIRLLMDAQTAASEGKQITKSEQVENLRKVGLKDTEIGRIIGYERKNVAAMRTNLKRRKSK